MKTLVLGVGNLLMGDEGVGIHAVNRLEERRTELGVDASIDIVDGGTGGFHLLELFERYERIVIVDATIDEKAPGSITVLRPRYSEDYPRTLSAHDIGLKDLIDTAALLGTTPEVVLVTVTIENESIAMGTEPSETASRAADEAARSVAELLRSPDD